VVIVPEEKQNIHIDEKEQNILFSVNPNIYPLKIIYAACYVMSDRSYLLLDGNLTDKTNITIKKKIPNQDLKQLARDFNRELLNYTVHDIQSKRNKNIRELLLQRVLLTNDPDYFLQEDSQLENEEAPSSKKIHDVPTNITTTKKDNVKNITFNLNSSFYSKDAIFQTFKTFNYLCSGTFDQKTFDICLWQKEPELNCLETKPLDLTQLKNEFCTYCLGLMK